MKKIGLTILALAALSTASYAESKRSNDLRESPICFGKYCENATTKSTNTDGVAFAVENLGKGWTAYERMMKTVIENEHGRH